MRRELYGLAIAIAMLAPTCASAAEADDKEMATDIAAILRDCGKVKNYSIGVKCKDGSVWLAGRVSSKQQMSAALDVVSDIEGVKSITNRLTIGPAKADNASKVQLAAAQQMAPQAAPPGGAAPAGYRQIPASANMAQMPGGGRPLPAYVPGPGNSPPPAAYDQPNMPNHAWPSYAAYPNYAAVTYPKQYSASAWPYIGPFYPYPQVPLGWRKVSLEWDDGWWFLDFDDRGSY